jgi:ABC-type polysaccharide/polyol phosphate export permease
MRLLLVFLRDLLKNRKIVFKMARTDFKSRFLGSLFGVIWGFVNPIVTMLIYWFVFEFGLRTGVRSDNIPFVLWMVTGMVPWLFVNDVIPSTASSLIEYSYIVKKIVFNLKFIPVFKILSSSIVNVFFLMLNVILLSIYGFYPTVYWLQIPVLLLYTYTLVMAVGYLAASVVPFFRDLPQIITIILQIGFWATPIVWDISSLDDSVKALFQINPIYHIVEGYRSAFLYQTNYLLQTPSFWVVFFILAVVLILSIRLYNRLEASFADSL